MPELPEVETIVRELRDSLPGKSVLSIQEHYKGTVRNKIADCSKDYHNDISFTDFGHIDSVERRGKYIIINLQKGLSLIVHLRMTGKLILACNRGHTLAEEHQALRHIRAVINLSDDYSLLFNDPRTFGKIDIISTIDADELFQKLGCEPLTKDLSLKYLSNKFSKSRVTIKKALLDQTVIAGIGNIYANEILYRCNIYPFKSVCNLTEAEISNIIKETRKVLKKAITCNGTTISDFRRVDDKQGSFQNFLQVYGKKECPKGHPVNRVKSEGRSTFYCPVCQKDTPDRKA